MIKISIDCVQIDKAKLKTVTRRNGETARFLELVLIETPNGEFGDYMVKQDTTKEEREGGVKLPILGNGKIVGKRQEGANPPNRPKREPELDEREIPF